MAMPFTRPDPGNPAQVAEAAFSISRKGFDQAEVRDFLQMVAAELSRVSERVRFLEREVDAAHTSPEISARLDEETLTRLLGEETARVLTAARSSATEIREKAETAAAHLVSEANTEAARIRSEVETEASRRRADAAADAEAELEMAKQQGREMVNEARAYRERVLSELSRRRELAREQIEQLVHGRDRLVAAFERARIAAVDVMADLEPLGEPEEYVNLTPTTGPVPVMVARDDEGDDTTAVAAPDAEIDGDAVVAGDDVAEVAVASVVATDPAAVDEPDLTVVESDVSTADSSPTEPTVETEQAEPTVEPEQAEQAEPTVPAQSDDVERDDVVVDLFARLRSGADSPDDHLVGDETSTDDDLWVVETGDDVAGDGVSEDAVAGSEIEVEDGAFEQRDAEITPLIVASARKLKRVLADEQNDVLDALRQASSVASVDDLVPDQPEQSSRYADAIGDDLLLASQAGAGATDADNVVTLARPAARRCVDAAGEQLAERLIAPLRDRLQRAVSDSGGEPEALTKKVRAVYREVKTRQIDDVLDDVFRSAHGAGFFAAVPDDRETTWRIDARHPACPDCDDNSLSPPVARGDEFPTGHVSTPAHPGCRCMLEIAPR